MWYNLVMESISLNLRLSPRDQRYVADLVAALGDTRQGVIRRMIREGHEKYGQRGPMMLLDVLTGEYGAGAKLNIRVVDADAPTVEASVTPGKDPSTGQAMPARPLTELVHVEP